MATSNRGEETPSCDALSSTYTLLQRFCDDGEQLVDRFKQKHPEQLKCCVHKKEKCDPLQFEALLKRASNLIQALNTASLSHVEEHIQTFRGHPGRAEVRQNVSRAHSRRTTKADSGIESCTSTELKSNSSVSGKDIIRFNEDTQTRFNEDAQTRLNEDIQTRLKTAEVILNTGTEESTEEIVNDKYDVEKKEQDEKEPYV